MKKQLKKYGNTIVASFNKEEQFVYGVEAGTIIEWQKSMKDKQVQVDENITKILKEQKKDEQRKT